jgi:predicted nucleic acid-binding protein
METVYLETSFISYLVARPSRDLLVAARQQIAHEWWADHRSKFSCCVSQIVIDEASAGDVTEAQKRIAIIAGLTELEISTDAISLTRAIMAAGMLPGKAIDDATHIAVAAVHGVDYLLTWNCKHLANAQIAKRKAIVCEENGWRMPIICNPDQLMGE